jgi:hypothetical protein
VGYVCGLSKTNGKNGKHGMRCVKWLILKGFVFSVFYSVFYSVFRSVLPFKGEPVGGLWEAVWFSFGRACFPFSLPLSQLFCWVEQ